MNISAALARDIIINKNQFALICFDSLLDAAADSKKCSKCPVCTAVKEKWLSAEKSCDKVALYYDCQYEDPFCVSTKDW